MMACLLAAAIIALAGSLLWKQADERRNYQFTADLAGMEYNGEFLEKMGKMQGIRQVYPVLEIPVRLKMDDYTVDTVIQAVDVEILDKKVEKGREVPVGSTPVLLLGKDSLAGMRDSNDHMISEAQQKKFLEDYDEQKVTYSVYSAASSGESGGTGQWKECIVAGILSYPAEGIYLPYDQGRALCENTGDSELIKKALITVQGRENYERVQSYFTALGQS